MDWLFYFLELLVINILFFPLFYALDGLMKHKEAKIMSKNKLGFLRKIFLNSKLSLQSDGKPRFDETKRDQISVLVFSLELFNYLLMISIVTFIIIYQWTQIPSLFIILQALLGLNLFFLLMVLSFYLIKSLRS